ncbi:MAG: exodeoxyribonuclease VII large subunit [Candidatus Aminicenantes bacterium]|nr:exodeoxyribonuclease VII large subunit [Candidatus Aminicenantes bacterium]
MKPETPDRIFSVSEVTGLVKAALEGLAPRLWVEGEISNFHRHSSGHLYFTLKDEKSQLRAVMFRSDARAVAFDLKDGLKVLCRGRLSVYEPRGEYQLYAEAIQPKGKGALQLAFEQLKEKLRAEGLFDPARKRPLPLRPAGIGIVTSPTGAALRDILRVLDRRHARLGILIYPARVQGAGAADEIAEGIRTLGGALGVEVLIVGRGGGSLEDLWAFNEEKVARAIAACPRPVISAVGHEVDFTISDFAADLRAPTPSAAAEMVVETEAAFLERIVHFESTLALRMKYKLRGLAAAAARLTRTRAFPNFRLRLLNAAQRVDDLETRAWKKMKDEERALAGAAASLRLSREKMAAAAGRLLQDALGRWERLSSALDARSPLAILAKGYALVWDPATRRIIRTAAAVRPGAEVAVSFRKGEIDCEVKAVRRAATVESRFKETP